ncbi:MAG: O-antigen ligase family protein [Desulfohalobiaceae bacterium]
MPRFHPTDLFLSLILAGYFFGVTAFYIMGLSWINPFLGTVLLIFSLGFALTGQGRMSLSCWMFVLLLTCFVLFLWMDVLLRSGDEQRLVMAATYQLGALVFTATAAHRISPRVFLGIALGGLAVLSPLALGSPAQDMTEALRSYTLYADAANVLAAMLPVLGGVLLWLADDALQRSRKILSGVYVGLVLLVLFCILMIGARQSLLAFLPWLTMLYFLGRRKWLGMGFIGLAAAFAVLAYLDYADFVLQRWQGFLALLDLASETGEKSVPIRVMLIIHGSTAWLDAPVLGHGIRSFRELAGFDAYAHNNYIEMLFGMGLSGFLLFHIPVFWALIKGCRQAASKTQQARWGALMFGSAGYILVQGMFIETFARHVVWVCLMLIIYSWRRLETPPAAAVKPEPQG